jgi:type I restriction enzyme S subunit
MAEKERSSIPESWAWKQLDEVAEINPTLDRDQIEEDISVSFVPMKRVEELSGHIDLSETRPISEVASRYTYFAEGDVIFAKITPCMENGKTAIAEGLENGVGFGSTEFHVVRPSDDLLDSWAFYYLIQEGFRRDAKRRMTGSAGQKRVPTGYMEKIQLPVPPLSEQRRIVAKIEEFSSGLDAGVADLKKTQKQLQRYRKSVLQAAVEGRLTEDWREEHDTEPADKLLERILEERRAQWEKDYRAKYEAKGKEPPSGWKSRYTPPEEPDLPADLAPLPDGWMWTNTEHVGKVITGSTPKTSVDEYYGGGYPFYRPGDLDTGYHTRSAEKTITEAGLAEARFLAAESTLVTCIGGTIGKTGFIRKAGASNQQINALTPYKPLLPRYAYFVCVSPQFQNRIHQRSSSTTMPILNKGKFQSLAFPLPPLDEQRQIVNEVERLLSVADEATQAVEREIKRAERLRQSILKQAFSGKLLEQSNSPGSVEEAAPVAASVEGEQIEMPL